jgi:malate permease and related proteins
VLDVLVEVVLPILAVALVGGAVGHRAGLDARPLSAVTVMVLTPALVFSSLATTDLPSADALRVVVVLAAVVAANAVVAHVISVAAGWTAAERGALVLAAMTPNLGNLGLPVSLLAFGDDALPVASVALVTGAVLNQTTGMGVAARASGASTRQAVMAPIRYPGLWAAAAGVAVNVWELDVPLAIERAVDTAAAGAVPVMLVILGLQLWDRTPLEDSGGGDRARLAVAVGNRLVLGPVVGWAAASAVGLDEVGRDTMIVLAAMPTAVVTTVIAARFDARPRWVTRAVVVSTACAVLTLSALVAALR